MNGPSMGTTALTPNNLTQETLNRIAEEISAMQVYESLLGGLVDLWGHEMDQSKVYLTRMKPDHVVLYVPRARLHTVFNDMLKTGVRVRLEPREPAP